MKRIFEGQTDDPRIKQETLEVETGSTGISFFIQKFLMSGRKVYSKILISKKEFIEFMEKANEN